MVAQTPFDEKGNPIDKLRFSPQQGRRTKRKRQSGHAPIDNSAVQEGIGLAALSHLVFTRAAAKQSDPPVES